MGRTHSGFGEQGHGPKKYGCTEKLPQRLLFLSFVSGKISPSQGRDLRVLGCSLVTCANLSQDNSLQRTRPSYTGPPSRSVSHSAKGGMRRKTRVSLGKYSCGAGRATGVKHMQLERLVHPGRWAPRRGANPSRMLMIQDTSHPEFKHTQEKGVSRSRGTF